MSYPVTYRKLFGNDGAGPQLRDDILPDTALKTTAQTLSTTQKTQVQTNLDVQSASELTTALSELIVEYGGTVPSS